MLCSKCKTENPDEATRCSNCGEELVATPEEVSQPEPVVHQRITGIDLKPDNAKDKATGVSNGLYIGILIATVIFPIIGVVMGLTYMRKEHPSAKKAGKNWLIAGLVMILFNIILINVL